MFFSELVLLNETDKKSSKEDSINCFYTKQLKKNEKSADVNLH